MEPGEGARVEAAVAACFAGTTYSSSEEHGRLASRPYKSVNLFTSLQFDYRGQRSNENGYGNEAEMKVMIFPVKYGKYR